MKFIKQIFISLLSISLVLGTTVAFNHVNAKETPDNLTYAANPYPEHEWICLGTITLDPVTINRSQDIKDIIVNDIWPIVGVISIPAAIVLNKIASKIDTGHTTFYIQLTQYISTDYEWHYYSYTVYEDKACTKSLGTTVSTKWQTRSRKLKSNNLLNLVCF